ncbi:MAG: hypothetical protein ABSA48_13375 [Terracidiphilus sp.]|jgi:hypothetical protein
MKDKIALLMFFGAILLGPQTTKPQKPTDISEQRIFSAEDENVKSPVDLTKGALDVLAREKYVSEILKNQDMPPEKLPSSWFMASAIHLGGRNEVDLIVLGKCPLCGANVVPFWVLRPKGDGFETILFTGALSITVQSRRSNGYRQIETASVTMQKARIYRWRFDGVQYRTSDISRNTPDATN